MRSWRGLKPVYWVRLGLEFSAEDPKRLGKAREPVGPVAGKEMAAMYAFDGGCTGIVRPRPMK